MGFAFSAKVQFQQHTNSIIYKISLHIWHDVVTQIKLSPETRLTWHTRHISLCTYSTWPRSHGTYDCRYTYTHELTHISSIIFSCNSQTHMCGAAHNYGHYRIFPSSFPFQQSRSRTCINLERWSADVVGFHEIWKKSLLQLP